MGGDRSLSCFRRRRRNLAAATASGRFPKRTVRGSVSAASSAGKRPKQRGRRPSAPENASAERCWFRCRLFSQPGFQLKRYRKRGKTAVLATRSDCFSVRSQSTGCEAFGPASGSTSRRRDPARRQLRASPGLLPSGETVLCLVQRLPSPAERKERDCLRLACAFRGAA